mmetsp:Transcript_13655/g.29295  ORF Transcript_13655/g.29295 Transcript_13655/m.29295 type:complete len:105 (+) Transcript_13655:890-1204(+)
MGLAPVIDLLNHRGGAAKPSAFLADDEDCEQQGASGSAAGQQHAASSGGQVLVYVTSAQDDKLVPLSAGDELCTSYVAAGTPPLTAFLNFGYVPPELLKRAHLN